MTRLRKAQFLREPDALQLTRGADGDLGENQNLPRHLVWRESRRRKLSQFLVRCRLALAQHDRRRDVFAEHVVWHGEGDALMDRGMLHDDLIDFPRRDLLTPAVDDLLEPASNA